MWNQNKSIVEKLASQNANARCFSQFLYLVHRILNACASIRTWIMTQMARGNVSTTTSAEMAAMVSHPRIIVDVA